LNTKNFPTRPIVDRSKAKGYIRNIITLMAGTGLSQVIPLVLSPVLTRIYSPDDFGVLAIFSSIAAVAGVAVTGRYELAIIIPKKDTDSIHMLALSILLSCLGGCGLMLGIIFLYDKFVRLSAVNQIGEWLYWVPLSTVLIGVYTSLNYWNNRKSLYTRLALSRVVQTVGGIITQILLGLFQTGPGGLVLGQLAGQFAVASTLGRSTLKENKEKINQIRWRRMRNLSIVYKKFPLYLILAHGFHSASGHLPTILLSGFANAATVGNFALIQRIIGSPSVVLATAIGDVFRQEASQAYTKKNGCKKIYTNTLKRLFLVSLFPFFIFYAMGPKLIVLLFGVKWESAGQYAKILAPMFFLQFVTKPLSSMFMIAGKQKHELYWQLVLFVSSAGAFIFGFSSSLFSNPFLPFVCVYCCMYIINGLMSYRFAHGESEI
jgi:O-antigen/teichoic acid export membrane protein